MPRPDPAADPALDARPLALDPEGAVDPTGGAVLTPAEAPAAPPPAVEAPPPVPPVVVVEEAPPPPVAPPPKRPKFVARPWPSPAEPPPTAAPAPPELDRSPPYLAHASALLEELRGRGESMMAARLAPIFEDIAQRGTLLSRAAVRAYEQR